MRFTEAGSCEFIHKLKVLPWLHQPRGPKSRVVSFGAMTASVSSEIGRLRAVLVHSPGPELLAVTPTNRADYLYDDIIEAEAAQREHRRFIAILERFTTVYQVR